MILHVLTACSRPEALPRLAEHLARARAARVDLRWHVGLDLERRHVGGQAVKNRQLDEVRDGWVWVCDDDNLPHPDFFARLAELEPDLEPWAGVLFAQQRGPAEGGRILPARPPRPGHADIAQLVVRRDWVAGRRIPETYDGDGHFLARLYADGPIALRDEPITLYNGASWWGL